MSVFDWFKTKSGASQKPPQRWGYQLQNVVPEEVAASRHDYMVVDWTSDGETAWTRGGVEIMKRRVGGLPPRKVLAYVSIGEAESYRAYWKNWRPGSPQFVRARNPEWPDNYPVEFWNPEWKNVVNNMLTQTVLAGFDGVYLDKVDVFEDIGYGRDRMIDWVCDISRELKTMRPGFLVFPQNGDGLLSDPRYRAAIDGVGREDLLYGEDGDRVRNNLVGVSKSIANLLPLARENKPVLAVEYGWTHNEAVERELRATGISTLVPLVTTRELDRIP